MRSIAVDPFGRVVACRIGDVCRQPEARHDAVIYAAVDLTRAGALTDQAIKLVDPRVRR